MACSKKAACLLVVLAMAMPAHGLKTKIKTLDNAYKVETTANAKNGVRHLMASSSTINSQVQSVERKSVPSSTRNLLFSSSSIRSQVTAKTTSTKDRRLMAVVASQKSQAAVRASLVSENNDKIRNLLAIKSQAAIPGSLVSNESANKVRNLLATIDNVRAAKKANTYDGRKLLATRPIRQVEPDNSDTTTGDRKLLATRPIRQVEPDNSDTTTVDRKLLAARPIRQVEPDNSNDRRLMTIKSYAQIHTARIRTTGDRNLLDTQEPSLATSRTLLKKAKPPKETTATASTEQAP